MNARDAFRAKIKKAYRAGLAGHRAGLCSDAELRCATAAVSAMMGLFTCLDKKPQPTRSKVVCITTKRRAA